MSSILPSPQFNSRQVDQFEMAPTPEGYPTRRSSAFDRISLFCSTYLNPSAWIQSDEPPPSMGSFNPNRKIIHEEIVVFGDIHGEIYGLIENLLNAGLIDQKGNWAGKNQILVQLGDVIDRGFASESSWNYLAALQIQAENSEGTVVRLIGNHELMVLQGNYQNAMWVIANPPLFAQKVKREILAGKVQLAYTDGKRLFVHAGLRSEMRHRLIKEIMLDRGCSAHEVYLEDIVEHLNQHLIRAVTEDDFSHPIFHVGHSRGGDHQVGGVLWEDMSELIHSQDAREIPQVIGHNPPRGVSHPPIRITDSHKLVEVDAGLNAVYGGNRAYVVFNSSEIKIREKDTEKNEWVELVAKDILRQSNLAQPETRFDLELP